MGANLGQKSTVTDGLVLFLDAGNPFSGHVTKPTNPTVDLVNAGFTAVAAPTDSYGLQNVQGGDTYFVSMYSSSSVTNQVIYSKDGTTWSSAAPAANKFWRDVTFGNGKFVMVANSDSGNEIQYALESNITSWTAANPPESNNWAGVIYGNGKFVAVAGDGTNRVMYASESNLSSWSSASAAEDNSWRSIAYGNGRFVAVSVDGTNRVMYALDSDVTSWTSASASAANEWTHVTYGDGYFVAVAKTGTVGSRVMYSTDGISWTSASSFTQEWGSVTYGDGYFVASNSDTDTPATSTCIMWAKSSDLSTWTMTDVEQAGVYSDVGFKQGRFVATIWSTATNKLAYADVSNRVWNDISKYRSPHMNYSLPWLWDLKGTSSSLELNIAGDTDQYWGLTDGAGNNYGDISLFNFAASNYSIELWMNRYDGFYILDMRSASDGDHSYIGFNASQSNRLVWRPYGASVIFGDDTDNPTATDETWTGWRHYAITREGTGSNECKLYYNGSLIATGTDSGTHTTPGYFKIGTKHDNAASFKGKLGLFKIYNGRALTATEILDSYNMTKGRYE